MLRELRPTLIAAHGHTRPPQHVALVRQSTIPDADLVEMRGVDSHGESWMRCRILDAGLPRPVLQHETVLRDGRVRYLDAAWPQQRVGREHDGHAHHVSRGDVEHDLARRAELEEDLYWRIVIAIDAGIVGSDDSFERELGALLGVDVRPRRW